MSISSYKQRRDRRSILGAGPPGRNIQFYHLYEQVLVPDVYIFRFESRMIDTLTMETLEVDAFLVGMQLFPDTVSYKHNGVAQPWTMHVIDKAHFEIRGPVNLAGFFEVVIKPLAIEMTTPLGWVCAGGYFKYNQ